MEAILTDSVQNSLRQFMHRNAIFICERLCAEFPSETNLQLLAGCFLQNNQAYAAHYILKGMQMAQSRYLFAMSCFQMDLLNEAEAALYHSHEPGAEIPNGAAGHYLLGLIYRYTDRRKNAVHHFKKALSMDPLLWSAYEELCVLGAADEATSVFGEAASLCIKRKYLNQGSTSQNLHTINEERNLASAQNLSTDDISSRNLKHLQGHNTRDIHESYQGTGTLGGAVSQPPDSGPSDTLLYNTPSPMAMQLSGVAPPPLHRNVQLNSPSLSTHGDDSSPRSTENSSFHAPWRKFVDKGKSRKISGTLFSDSGSWLGTILSGESGSNAIANATAVCEHGTSNSFKYVGGSKSGSVPFRKGHSWANENLDKGTRDEFCDNSRSNITPITSSTTSGNGRSLEQEGALVSVNGVMMNGTDIINGASETLALLRILGEGHRLSCMFRCQDAVNVYMKLPRAHYNTSWVLGQVGKTYFELVDYLEADQAFSLARQASPYSLEGMDIYSTVLYHLNEDMKLSYLAQELVSTNRLAPQSWIALGNCYSLQKDHESALKNFHRAIQLDSRFVYAHTLCGHEYVSLEDFDNGIKSYQSALRSDARHYNAWHGLGMIYLRQEKFQFSAYHFRMALNINPCSSVIMTYLGTALHTLKKEEEALEMMESAILADGKNPLPMYQKANILVSLERYDEALEILEELKEHTPRESCVYALMGKIYMWLNMRQKAVMHFGLALDLKPSSTDLSIKAALEKLHLPDELQDSL